MAPIPESVYFPQLEQCLLREKLLFSWETVYVALCDLGSCERNQAKLQSFLSDGHVLQLLRRPFNPFAFTPGNQSKTAFETKTAAINVTPTNKIHYDISEIKDDTLWLSKEVEIDEISSLRIVTLEHQLRASTQLQGDFSDEEIASLEEVAGNVKTETSVLVSRTLASRGSVSSNPATFASPDARRLRQLRLYLSECRNLIKCTEVLLHTGIRQVPRDTSHKGKGKETQKSWVEDAAQSFSESVIVDGKAHEYLNYCVKSLRGLMERVGKGSGWFKSEGGRQDIELIWLNSQISQAINTLEIIFVLLDYHKDVRTSANLLEWFQFASTYGYFDQFEPPHPSLQPLTTSLQSLIAMVSLSMLDPLSSLTRLNEQQHSLPNSEIEQDDSYLTDIPAMLNLHDMLLNAATRFSINASPAILAWAVILLSIRSSSTIRKDARELRQSQRAEERLERDFSPEVQDDQHLAANGRPHQTRRSSTSSDISLEASMYDELLENIMDTTHDEDPIAFLGTNAIDGAQVLDVLSTLALTFESSVDSNLNSIFGAKIRILILELIHCSIGITRYVPEIVTATLAALVGNKQYWDQQVAYPLNVEDDPVATFLDDPYMVEQLLYTARSRYPYESLPFLKIVHAIATCETRNEDGIWVVLQILQSMPSFTFELAADFMYYETSNEDENSNTIRLTRPAMLFRPQGKLIKSYDKQSDGWSLDIAQTFDIFQIPPGTVGRIVSEDGPKVAIWYHEYSGLKYLGKLLETGLTSGDYVDATKGRQPTREDLTEIISLLATLVQTAVKMDKSSGDISKGSGIAIRLLEETSDGLDRSRDIISVVFFLFEEELQRQSASTASDGTLDLLVAAVQFIHALMPILPGRVWPLLGRSGLLDQDGNVGSLSTILTGVELITSRYDFLISCTHLYRALVEDSVAHAVVRRSSTKSAFRFGRSENLGTGVPKYVVSKVLLSFTTALTSIFEVSCNWRFAIPEQRLIISNMISGTFDDVLQYVYGIDDSASEDTKITHSLASSAEHIVQIFLSSTSGPLRFQPILRALLDGFATPDSVAELQILERWTTQVSNILRFSSTLIKIGALLQRPPSKLQYQLFKASPLIARLYAVLNCYRLPVTSLLETLIISASSSSDEPTSLLGQLGQQSSKSFLHVLSDLGKPLDDDRHVVGIWNLMSAVVGKRQQWFAIYLLTGRRPRETLKGDAIGEPKSTSTTSMLKIALELLSNIQTQSPDRVLAMLEFISLAQNFWPWTMSDVEGLSTFVKGMTNYSATIQLTPRPTMERMVADIQNTRIAAQIAEILAMYLYHLRQMGNNTIVKEVLPKLGFYTSYAVSVPSYNSSLHGNLKRNFDARFSGFTLENFKYTGLSPRRSEREFYYDIQVAEKVLDFDSAWKGRKDDGLAAEFVKANVNLSLVDAQVALLHGWQLLATELSANLPGESVLQDIITKTVSDCLVTNMKIQPPENLFARLNQTRADLALILLQRLVEGQSTLPQVRTLLDKVWDTIRNLDTNFGLALASGDAPYYRSLLKLLFLALRAYRIDVKTANSTTDGSTALSPESGPKLQPTSVHTVLEILDHIVARGFRDLVAGIHDQQLSSAPDDIALVTAILQAGLRVPGIEFCHSQIIDSMAACDTARVATTLFSWADKLAIDGDPVFGELSILFLLELSSMPKMAEQLAVQGILGQISSASLTTYLRRNNVTPFADGAGLQRCYSLWARGILPLILNILDSVGASVATEAAVFLNQFPNLLKQSADSFDAPGATRRASLGPPRYFTFSTVSEVHSTALITFILNTFRASPNGVNEIPEVVWDGPGVLEDVEFWLGSRHVLRERIIPVGAMEVELVKRKPINEALGCQNRLEEKVVEELMGIVEVLTVREV